MMRGQHGCIAYAPGGKKTRGSTRETSRTDT
jgi:hypothetical protein